MPRPRTAFVCSSCGAVHSKWSGKCPDCAAWNTLQPQTLDAAAARDPQRGVAAAFQHLPPPGAAPLPAPGAHDPDAPPADAHDPTDHDPAPLLEAPRALPLALLDADAARRMSAAGPRLVTGVAELDRVLGGGITPGSAVLVGGDPGVGKSTLLLQAAAALAARGVRTLYVSSEESAEQVRRRAARLADDAAAPAHAVGEHLFLLADTNLARIVEQARRVAPALMVIDSIQMIYKADVDASPGSLTQLRRCCTELVYLSKAAGVAVALVGHVTKDGALAGPRLLEHLVDAVLYFEGDRHHAHRVLRAVKNRFGTTLEIGLFEMTGSGLRQVDAAGVAARLDEPPRPGSAVCPVLSGSRCMMVEVQALTATGFLGAAKRKVSGLDPNRAAMLIAALEQHAGLRLADRDIFASAVGGVRVVEPAADLALLLAIAGAHTRRALQPATAVVGEVGLGGEVRPAHNMEQRLREAARLGYARVITPRAAVVPRDIPGPTALDPVRSIHDAIERLS